MQILGIIILVVGIVLFIVGKNLTRYLPPNYQENDEDGFLQLLKSMGKLVCGGGIVFLAIGLICMFL